MMLLLFSHIKVMTSLIFAFSNNKSENMQSCGITPAFSQLDLPTASSAIIRLSQDNVILTKFPENWKLVSNSRNQLQVTQCALSIFSHFIIKKSSGVCFTFTAPYRADLFAYKRLHSQRFNSFSRTGWLASKFISHPTLNGWLGKLGSPLSSYKPAVTGANLLSWQLPRWQKAKLEKENSYGETQS